MSAIFWFIGRICGRRAVRDVADENARKFVGRFAVRFAWHDDVDPQKLGERGPNGLSQECWPGASTGMGVDHAVADVWSIRVGHRLVETTSGGWPHARRAILSGGKSALNSLTS